MRMQLVEWRQHISGTRVLGGMRASPVGASVRLAKRNKPCPCGSGSKFKKCCYR